MEIRAIVAMHRRTQKCTVTNRDGRDEEGDITVGVWSIGDVVNLSSGP